jgi:two-component system OmpR family response regulator
LLLAAHATSAAGLARILDPATFSLTVAARPTDVSRTDVETFDGILLGPDEPLDDRAGHCRAMRDFGYLGAIVALCDRATDGEHMLDAGADDFVASPYEASELAARLRACARRIAARSHLRWGSIDLDRVARVVRVADARITLSARESELLACLMEEGGRVVSRAKLRERVWQRKEDRGTNLVEVYLSRLRDKLGEHAVVIETVRHAGYRLRG